MSMVSSGRKSIASQASCKSKVVPFLPEPYNLKALLLDFVNEKDRNVYENLVCQIRDASHEILDEQLMQLLKEARSCVNLLDQNLRLFVQVLLILKWTWRGEDVVREYQGFLLDLCSAHNYYTKFTLDQLVCTFKEEQTRADEGATLEKCYDHVHSVIKHLLRIIPMCMELLVSSVIAQFPYIRRPASELHSYVHNVLHIVDYAPQLRYQLLSLIVNRLLEMDVVVPRHEIESAEIEMDVEGDEEEEEEGVFTMEENGEERDVRGMRHPIAHSLDLCMDALLSFVHSECHDRNDRLLWDRTRALYADVLRVFETVLLPTHAPHHVQFVIFYLVSFKPALATAFLQFLWHKVASPSVASVIRQAAAAYAASLMSRANFISLGELKGMLVEMSSWIHCYITSRESADGDTNSCDIRRHSVFYSVCQALFYVIAFRHRHLVNSHKGLLTLQALNLGKMVTCRLNPLRVCLPTVVSNFASVTRAYQLAYCYIVLERNAQNRIPLVYRDESGAITATHQVYLDTFFPFDPYILHRSGKRISPLYREYESGCQDDSAATTSTVAVPQPVTTLSNQEDVDDFLEASPAASSPSALLKNPGFFKL